VAGDARLARVTAALLAADRRPPAIIDTIGVDPECAHRGVGDAPMSRLIVNLDAQCVERVETIPARLDLALAGVLDDRAFAPSQRMACVRAAP
jgi:hypothetical protein